MKTLLERAKGTPLSILVSGIDPVSAVKLLSPHTKQIADLEFENNRWAGIQKFFKINSEPLPLLHTLKINAVQDVGPAEPVFGGAVGLKEFRLYSRRSPFLSRFTFPSLTFLELSVVSEESFSSSELLDFLEASPTLQAVRMEVVAPISLEGIRRERVVVLHHVESFCLVAQDGSPGYELVTHISCPSVNRTSLIHTRNKGNYLDALLQEFPAPPLLNAIIRQYKRSPIEEITLETKSDSDYFIVCSLTLQSADATAIELRFELAEDDQDQDQDTPTWKTPFAEIFWRAFYGASRVIQELQDFSLSANIRRLHIYGPVDLHQLRPRIGQIANDFEGLFDSLGPLEELTIHRCDMRPHPFIRFTKYSTYPPIKVFTISNPSNVLNEEFMESLVGFAMAQHERGVPFERMSIRMHDPPTEMEEMLRPWVGAVDCIGLL